MIFWIPVIGWLVGAFFAFFAAIPFYFLWNALAPTYCYWLPEVYLQIPFWHCVGLFILILILKFLLGIRLVNIEQKVKGAKK